MRLLILSDLHVGKSARTKVLCPYPEGENKDKNLVSSFIQSIKDEISIGGDIDFIVIPGDMTHEAQEIEYKCFSDFISNISSELKIDIDKFVFIPGNHDVNWKVFTTENPTTAQKEIESKKKYDSIKDSRFHLLGSLIPTDLFDVPYFSIKEFDNAVFVLFNSAWHDEANLKNHYGIIESEHLAKLGTVLEEIKDKSTDKLKFFIIHHHPFQYPNVHPAWKDFSILQNGVALLDLLSQNSFDFIIHGHKHVPYFYSLALNNLTPINLFCSGSYSTEIPIEIAHNTGNLYHIIEFDNVSDRKGKIISRAYDPIRFKWVKSGKENHGIKCVDYFGCSLKINEIYAICKEGLKDIDKVRYKRIIELEEQCPDLKYLPNQTKEKLISDIENDLNVKYAIASDKTELFIKI